MEKINEAWRNSAINDTHEDLPERTFFNHKKAISQIFGIDIEFDRELGYYIPNSQLNDNGLRTWLLQTLSVNNLLNESTDLRERILFENVPSVKPHLADIIRIMKDGNAMNLTYKSYNNKEPYTFLAHPYCLKMFKQRWYLLAQTPKYEHPTIYSLDRIIDVEELDSKAEIPQGFNAKEYFKHYYGIITGDGSLPQTIKLKVQANQAPYIQSLRLHDSQNPIESNDEYTIFQYYLAPTYDFIKEILSYGDTVVVLEPEDLALKIRDIAQYMVENYL